MNLTELSIHPARQKDVPFIAEMIKLSMGSLADHLFGMDDWSIKRQIENLVRRNAGRFGLRFSFVAEAGGISKGALLSYKGGSVDYLNAATCPHLFSVMGVGPALRFMMRGISLPGGREAVKDEYYISNLGVDPASQGQGIGSALLKFAEELTRDQKLAKCSLIVGLYNQDAFRFYQRHGYEVVETVQDKNKTLEYHRMVKKLSRTPFDH